MYCTVCKTKTLKEKEIDKDLFAYQCDKCEGLWIRANDYEKYINFKKDDSETERVNIEYKLEYDSKKASFCPDCGRILIKYKVTNDIPFFIDHCGGCNGVWLDKNEWETLVNNDLHRTINEFFTTPWQHKLREEMTKSSFDKHYKETFGAENYNRIKEVREWIYTSDVKEYLLNFLIDDEPYKL